MEHPTTDTSRLDGMTEAQATILDKFATIEAELACLLRETIRTRQAINNKDPRRT